MATGGMTSMSIVADKLPFSGLDFTDPDNRGTIGRSVPTIGILPRGHHTPAAPKPKPVDQGFDIDLDDALL